MACSLFESTDLGVSPLLSRTVEILISKSWMKIDCFQISAVDTFRAFANYDSSNKYIFQNLTKSASVHSSQNGQRKRAKNGQSLSCKGPKLRKCAIKLQKKPKYDYRLFLMPEKGQINKDLPVDYGDWFLWYLAYWVKMITNKWKRVEFGLFLQYSSMFSHIGHLYAKISNFSPCKTKTYHFGYCATVPFITHLWLHHYFFYFLEFPDGFIEFTI